MQALGSADDEHGPSHKYILDLGGTPGDQGLVGEAEWYQQATVKQAELLACMSCQVL
jgi:hypothetical protein